jgi:hypothetical protein
VSRVKIALAIGAVAAIALPAVAEAGGTSKAKLWQNTKTTAVCGVEAGATKTLLCNARGVPRPPHGSKNVGDPFVQIKATGKPQLVLISQNSYVTNHVTTLSNGAKWSSNGVTCTAGDTVTCKNTSKHGFTIGKGKYKSF